MNINFEMLLEARRKVPIVHDNIHKYDIMCDIVLNSEQDEINVILPETFAFLSSYEKLRKAVFEKYSLLGMYEIGNIFGTHSPKFILYCLSKTRIKKIKVSKYTETIVKKDTMQSDKVLQIFENININRVCSNDDYEILKTIEYPVFSEQFVKYVSYITKWNNENIQPNDLENAVFFELDYYRFNEQMPAPKMNTEEVLVFFENLKKEAVVTMGEIADIKSSMRPSKESHKYRIITYSDLDSKIDFDKLQTREMKMESLRLYKNDIIVNTIGASKYSLIKEDVPDDICAKNMMVIRPKLISPEYLFLYLQSDRVKNYFNYMNYTIQLVPKLVNELPIIMPCEEMIKQSEVIYKYLFVHDSDTIADHINSVLQLKNKVPAKKPLQGVIEEEYLEKLRLYKVSLVSDLLKSDLSELEKCFNAGAYKACIILCGSILETVLLDWLSEKENTNYFVEDEDKRINLIQVIKRIKLLQKNPIWTKDKEAHDVRLKRNLVHPVKVIIEKPVIDKELCSRVINETKEVLISRGISGNIL